MLDSTEKLQSSSGPGTGASSSQAVETLKAEDEEAADEEKKRLEKKEKDNQRFAHCIDI